MDSTFPITQRNGEKFHTLSDFKQLFASATSGRYILNKGNGWHGGIHLTSNMLPWGKVLRPIQAMLDGEIVAYRINPDYLSSHYKEQELKFSNNFVLIKHTAKKPAPEPTPTSENTATTAQNTTSETTSASASETTDTEAEPTSPNTAPEPEADFHFYSLYMHLAPPSDIGSNAGVISNAGVGENTAITTRYKLVESRNFRTFKLDADPIANKLDQTEELPIGTVFEYLYAAEQTTKTYKPGSISYENIKCKLISLPEGATNEHKALKGKTVWFASGLSSPNTDKFKYLTDINIVTPEPMTEPNWMSHSLAQTRDGSVQVIIPTPSSPPEQLNAPPTPESVITIKAGDDLGYMGLHEYSQDVHGTKKADNRVHIEVFSIEEPPEFFLKSLSAKNAEAHDFTLVNGPEINGVSDTGALDDTNLLFKEIATKITKVAAGEPSANFSLYTPKSIKTHLESKREDFEKLIVKHPSEWYDLSDDHMFNSILAAGLRTLEDKVITRFMSRDEYDNSSYKTLLLEAHDLLVDHEKERIDQLAWIQEASALEMPKELWYFWPICLSKSELITFDMIFAANLKKSEEKCRAIQPYINKYAINYAMTDPRVIAHFLSQIAHESHFTAATESLSYGKKRMREYFGCKGGKKQYNHDNDNCKLGQLRTKLWTDENTYARNSKNLGNYVYANRMDNGDENSGDGYKFRGRGLIQITGRDKYTAFTTYHNSKNINDQKDFLENPELVANSLDYATSSAFYYWYKFKKIKDDFSISASVEDITIKINGGTNGLKDRKKRYKMICKQMGILTNV